jgi:hypothetical protein
MSETIEERGKYRVRVVLDDDPMEPYDDGGSPILRYERREYDDYIAEQITTITSHKVDDRIVEALRQYGDNYANGQSLFERYLRMFHGTTEVVWRGGGWREYSYVTFDTAHWRQEMALTDEHIAKMREAGHEMRLADMSEYGAYLDGEVYGYVVEEEVTWVRASGETHYTKQTWEHVDSCWGFYDRDCVEEQAREALAAEAGEASPTL